MKDSPGERVFFQEYVTANPFLFTSVADGEFVVNRRVIAFLFRVTDAVDCVFPWFVFVTVVFLIIVPDFDS